MRQVCNVAFVAQAEAMDEKEYERWRKELRADPGKTVSHGTNELMRVMAMQGRTR